MRIDNWPLDRIMRLPDWCFGRRYWVGTYIGLTEGKVNIILTEEDLPDKFVVWGLLFSNRAPSMVEALRATVRLTGTRVAGAVVIPNEERLFKNISEPAIVYEFYFQPNANIWIPAERQIIESNGRRIVVMVNGDQTNSAETTCGVLISALPKEVPDWLILGRGKSQ